MNRQQLPENGTVAGLVEHFRSMFPNNRPSSNDEQ